MNEEAQIPADDEEAAFARANNLTDGEANEPEKSDGQEDVEEQQEAVADESVESGEAAEDQSSAEPQPEPFQGFKELPEAQQKAILAAIQEREQRANELERQARELDNRYRAQHGQLAPVQQQAARLLEENRRLQEQLQKGNSPDTKKYDELRERFKENFPEDAEALEAFLAPVIQDRERSRAEQEQLRRELAETRAYIERQSELQRLSAAHPDWKEHAPNVQGWIQTLDPIDRELAERQWASSSSEDSIRLLNTYKRDLLLAQALLEKEGATPKPAQKKAPKLDPNPRNRQSSAKASNGYSSEEEERFARAIENMPDDS